MELIETMRANKVEQIPIGALVVGYVPGNDLNTSRNRLCIRTAYWRPDGPPQHDALIVFGDKDDPHSAWVTNQTSGYFLIIDTAWLIVPSVSSENARFDRDGLMSGALLFGDSGCSGILFGTGIRDRLHYDPGTNLIKAEHPKGSAVVSAWSIVRGDGAARQTLAEIVAR